MLDMSEEKPKKNYIRYTAEELAAVPSPYQMERELESVCQQYGLAVPLIGIEAEYRLLKALGSAGYAAQRRLEQAARHHNHHPHRP